MQRAVDTLEKAAMPLRVMQEFGPREICTILAAMGQRRYKTCLLPELERQAEARSVEFQAQDVSTVLWSMARMAHWPGERLMRRLERQAENMSGQLTTRIVTKTLSAYATMHTLLGKRLMGQLARRAETTSEEFSASDVARLLWACAKIFAHGKIFAHANTPPRHALITAMLRRARAAVQDFDHEVADIIWALGNLNLPIPLAIVGRAQGMQITTDEVALSKVAQAVRYNPSMSEITKQPVSELIIRRSVRATDTSSTLSRSLSCCLVYGSHVPTNRRRLTSSPC